MGVEYKEIMLSNPSATQQWHCYLNKAIKCHSIFDRRRTKKELTVKIGYFVVEYQFDDQYVYDWT